MPQSREEWAEDHGYQRGRCPSCKRTIWSDSMMECSCGWSEERDAEDKAAEEENEDE